MSKLHNTKLLSKYLTAEDIKMLSGLTTAIEDNDTVVTCMGLYNHGKSTLLNALIKDLDGQTFKTADTRETTINKKVKHNKLTFVDTPGLNAQKNDDKRVMDAVKESDINIFVHNVNTGEFVAKEIEFFNTIQKHWQNPKEFIERTIFVLSRIDESNNNEDVKNTALRMNEQLIEIFDTSGYIVPVSSKDYIEGMIENEDELIELSNFTMFENKIFELTEKFTDLIKKTKKDRLAKYYEELIKTFNSKRETAKLELTKLENEHKKINRSFNNDIEKIETTLVEKYKTLGEV